MVKPMHAAPVIAVFIDPPCGREAPRPAVAPSNVLPAVRGKVTRGEETIVYDRFSTVVTVFRHGPAMMVETRRRVRHRYLSRKTRTESIPACRVVVARGNAV